MKFNFRTSKLANLFLMVLEFSYKREESQFTERAKEWIKETGSLTKNDEENLKSFSFIFSAFKSKNLDLVFLLENEKDVWKKTEKIIGNKNLKEMEIILSCFEKRFDIVWKKDKKKMEKIKDYFMENKKIFQNMIDSAKILCGIKEFKIENVPIHIFLSSSGKDDFLGWFSWSPVKSDIVLECSRWPIKKVGKFSLCLLGHEFFHLILRKNRKLMNLIKEISENYKEKLKKINYGSPRLDFLFEELLISSFIPEGYLAEKYAGIKIKKQKNKKISAKNILDFSEARKKYSFLIKEDSSLYVNEQKKIDKKYLEKLAEII
ncbi:MAG: hypothetical protein PHZ25_03295 [Candidatus Pacebacteria bacterium]|nr:hypothetical protein [Candidatus Paceibacterota bacterium]